MLVAGPAEGAPIVLLHGIPEGAEGWRTVLPRLGAAGYRAYAPDLPGYGFTRLPATADYSLAGAAELFAGWLSRERIAPTWVVGHDIGGAVAQILVVRHPHLVERLTISNAPVERSWPVTPVRVFRFVARLHLYAPAAALGLIPNPYAWWALRRGYANPVRLEADVARRVFWDSKVTDPRGRREFERHLAALDNVQTAEVATRLPEGKAPTLLLWGSKDVYLPWQTVGRRLQALLPRADVRLIEDAGHSPHLETPSAFVDALLTWKQSRTQNRSTQ